MKRSAPLVRTGYLRRTGRLRAVSDKRRAVLAERKMMLDANKADHCFASSLVPEVRCYGPLDPHEPLTRARGGSITDPENLLWICRAHHDWAHANEYRAHFLGLLKHSWEAS